MKQYTQVPDSLPRHPTRESPRLHSQAGTPHRLEGSEVHRSHPSFSEEIHSPASKEAALQLIFGHFQGHRLLLYPVAIRKSFFLLVSHSLLPFPHIPSLTKHSSPVIHTTGPQLLSLEHGFSLT